jgi:ABC-type cobalamin/Fe3+-siderophores transport system ATPase subunit
MIVGVLLRHYKVYEGLFYVPLLQNFKNKLSVFVGPNGVGKSSVLEALDCYFNRVTEWNINKKGKKDEAFIAPVFLINKNDIKLTEREKAVMEVLSNYFWDVSERVNSNIKSQPQLKNFIRFRNETKRLYDPEKYYFLILGAEYLFPNKVFFSTFANDIHRVLKDRNIPEKDVAAVKDKVLDRYSYIYIPVESSIQDVLNLESFEMTELMSKDVLREIEGILNKQHKINGKTSKARTVSLITLINEQLNTFIDEINNAIKTIDNTYSFKIEGHYKKNLTASDVRDIIIEKYVSIRTLKKDKKEISELSSGEQRIALIDIAHAFLAQDGERGKRIVLAIDEPEASMHMSYCFKQFKRISELATKYNHQVLLTTHWYGFVPTSSEGSLHHIEVQEKPTITTFNLKTVVADRKSFPDDIEMKSYFDLVGSIVSLVKSEGTNWLICEGPDDQMYFEHFLSRHVQNLVVLPVGGIGNVLKLYKYLYTPFSEKTEKKLLGGKILCLVDADPIRQEIDLPCKTTDNSLSIRRIQLDQNGDVTLPELNSVGYYKNTCTEDGLDPSIFFSVMKDVIARSEDDTIQAEFEKYYMDPSLRSGILSDGCPLLISNDPVAQRDKSKIYTFLSNHDVKYELAKSYVQLCEDGRDHSPIWLSKIIQIFGDQSKKGQGGQNSAQGQPLWSAQARHLDTLATQ